jgi:hypothetical protein
MKNHIRLRLIALTFILTAAGCSSFSGPVVKSSEALKEKSRQLSPPPGRAAVYVIRPQQFVAAGQAIPVFIDHDRFGSLPPGTYLYGEVMPREHILESAEMTGVKKAASLRFKADEGTCYFFITKVKMGIGGILSLESVSEEEGRKRIAKYKLSGDNKFEAEENTPTLDK